jgi:ubiquinone/menaquinone biosynthesis C-methylase UbiE
MFDRDSPYATSQTQCMAKTTSHERDYVPGLGRGFLTPLYDVLHRVLGVGRLHQLMIGLADAQPGKRVVDIGCGTGQLLLALGRQQPGLELAGMDPDERALRRAARRSRRARQPVEWRRGFAQELPYPDCSVDRVFSSLMLHHLEDESKDELLAEVRRVLRPDGVLVLADLDGHDAHRGHEFGRHLARRSTAVTNPEIVARIQGSGFETEPPTAYLLAGLSITVVKAHR